MFFDPKPDSVAATVSSLNQTKRATFALRELVRLSKEDDGSGIIEPQLTDFIVQLGDLPNKQPTVRIAAHTLLGEVLTGLGEDGRVAALLARNVCDTLHCEEHGEASHPCAVGEAAETVAIRLLRTIARMEAIELRPDVVNCIDSGVSFRHCPSLKLALEFTNELLGAAEPDKHPDEMLRVVSSFADRVMYTADVEMIEFFSEMEDIVHMRERDLRFGNSGKHGIKF